MTTIGILYPGDMGHNVARVLLEDGFTVVTTLRGRSERTRRLCESTATTVLGSLAEVVAQADLVVSIVPPAAAETVAAVILALRSVDGSDVTLPYTEPQGPGIYQPDPTALFVAWGQVTPFALRCGSQFRAKGPPALSSAKYAADYLEVQSVGALNSLTRTPDQTEAALFWVENIQITFNNIARLVAIDEGNSLADNARLFALLNLAGVDTTIAVMDTKYTFNFWRPREAIRAGDTDGNRRTIADPAWTPLTHIGVHPDYVSQHAAYAQAVATVLARFFGTDDIPFSLTTSTAPGGVARSYQSFSQAAIENMNSRVWLGAHFRTACRHGIKQGKQVAQYVMTHFLRPLRKHRP